ncbi:MAG: DUF402 domain-containing protein [Oscillospiraceae bacterium]|nr:DUF402 domain-containing protein [Oscillospiraceae bacterium]
MKRKELGRYDWRNVLKRRDAHCRWNKNGQQGEAALIHIIKAAKRGLGQFRGEPVVIYEDDYHWLQIAMEDCHWWLTVMVDGHGQITQYYFDITLENHLLGSRDSWFWDLYLDVVLMPDGRMDLLDADELDEALRQGDITAEQHVLAHQWAQELMSDLPKRLPRLKEFCEGLFAQLKGEEK